MSIVEEILKLFNLDWSNTKIAEYTGYDLKYIESITSKSEV